MVSVDWTKISSILHRENNREYKLSQNEKPRLKRVICKNSIAVKCHRVCILFIAVYTIHVE